MGKIKEYITKNKKIVIPVTIIMILILIGGIYSAVQANSDNMDLKADINPKQEMKETEKADKKDLTTYVKGLKNWTVETNAKNVDFLKDVTYDKKVVKEIIVDTSKVDLSKKGKYTLTYSIIPVDTSISKQTVIKTITVVSKEKAQKKADKVITSNNEVKQDSNDHTPTPKKNNSNQNNANTTNNSNTQNTKTNSSSKSNNNGDSSKLSTNNNSGNSNSNGTVKPQKPKHEHNFVYVPAKTHIEYETVTHTERVPKYKTIGWYECNHCHKPFEREEDVATHCEDVCGCGYSYKTKEVQNGTETITTKERVPHEVIDEKAHYECSCGKKHD